MANASPAADQPHSLLRPDLSPCAMVLAAGLGTRMRPLTLTTPKPLVRVQNRTLLDHVLHRLKGAGVREAVVNVHYLAEQIEAHVVSAPVLPVQISDERAALLDSGGGVKKVLSAFGGKPFLLANSDTLWLEDVAHNNVARLAEFWNPASMDCLLLLADLSTSMGFDGDGDFSVDAAGRLQRRRAGTKVPFAYAGVAIFKPELFEATREGAFSLNLLFDAALARGRLFGLRLEGKWMHVGTPASVVEAEALIAASGMV